MHVTPIAAKPSAGDGMAERPSRQADANALRVCVHAAQAVSAERLQLLRERLPRTATLAVSGPDGAWRDATHRLAGDPLGEPSGGGAAGGPLDLLRTAASAFPGEHLILVRADLDLPEFAVERLLRALEQTDVLGALPLDERQLDPDRSGVLRLARMHGADAQRLDALCYVCSDRRIDDDADFPPALPPLSAWHGERLALLGPARLGERDALDETGMRVVRLDHLYVETGAEAPAADRDEAATPSPLEPLRQRLAVALRADVAPARPGLDAKPVLLHVLHGWGGGAERWVRDFAAADTAAHHLILVARGRFSSRRHGEWLELRVGTPDGPPLRRWPLPRPIADTALGDDAYRRVLADVLRDYCVDALVVSSLIGHSLDALRTSLPLYCVVHDHYPLWPVLHRDFGDPSLAFDEAQRAADLRASGSEFAERDPQHWRRLRDATVAALLAARATLIAPTRSALANHLRLAPELGELPSRVIAHGLAPWPADAPAPLPPPARARLRLLIPGRIRHGKGAELLRAALPRLRERAELFLLGAGADAHALFGERGLHVVLDYRRDELPRLLAEIRPDAALLLPTVAETFSYILSELRSLALPVIATRVGALAERIEDGVDGFLVDADVAAILARVDALARQREALDAVRTRLAGERQPTPAQTALAYTELLGLPPRPVARYRLASTGTRSLHEAALETAFAQARQREATVRTELADAQRESRRRGDWGHALDRELGDARVQLRNVHEELDQRTRWATSLAAEVERQQQAISDLQALARDREAILASRSWQVTRPLRAITTRLRALRALRASLAYRALHLRSLGARVRGSLAQRGFAGTARRVLQELRRRGGGPVPVRIAYAAPGEDFAPFAVPTSAQPRVSIVIPVYNKIAYTSACLRSIAEHAGAIPFEVVVVDDGSSDETAQRLARIDGIRVVRNIENLGFIGSCNAGAATAAGEHLLFLNNDTVVTAGWLEALVRCLEQAPQAGLVGARLVYPDGRLQEAGGIVFDDGSGWNYGRFEDPDDTRYGFRREADYCSGAAIAIRRELFERLGAFDRRYAPAYYEDTDLAFAVRAAGFKVYYEPAATVVHFEGITSGTDVASGTKRYQVVNREKFLDKWKDALARQPAPGTPIARAATHRATRRVLIVDATTPTPDQDSGSLRMVNLMRVLADLGCQTSFLPDNRAWVEGYTAALQELGVEALHSPYAADPIALLRERGREFDLIVLSRHYVAASYVGLVRLYAPQATLAFDTVDLHYLREQRAAELAGKADLARHAAATRAQELKLIRECDVTFVVSPVEQELLAREAPGARVEVLSNVHEVYGCRRPYEQRRDLVFVGGFQHPPNTDAVEWFVHEVFPRLRAELPEVNFHVIGSKVPDSIRALADERVLVHGFIEDIAPYMDGCRISVAPLRYGAGVKGKVNMAMSYGLPVVATSAAVEGMHVRDGEDVLVADDAPAFAAQVLRLYRDEALWNRLSANGLANVERHFSFAAAREALRQVLR
jgi:GT2 family glycosyltransferase/glycosyltransferase involved in cell wall biosynthesis